MQSANKRTGNLLKKPKLIADESATDEPATDEPLNNEPPNNEPPNNEPPNNEPPNNEPPNNEPPNNEPPNDEPASEPATLESINGPAIIKLDAMEHLQTSREATRRGGTGEAMARSALVSPIEIDETTVGGTVERRSTYNNSYRWTGYLG
jgi:hypothetical protein